MNKWLVYILLISIPFGYYAEFATLFFVLVVSGKIGCIFKFPVKTYLPYYISFIIIETIIIGVLNYDLKKFFEQIVLITSFALLYRIFAAIHFKRPQTFCHLYLNFSLYLSIYSIIAFAFGKTYGGRAVAWAGEAGDLSLLLMPALCYYIFKNNYLNYRFFFCVVCFIMASSTASFVAIIITFCIRLINSSKHKTKKIISSVAIVTIIGAFWGLSTNDAIQNTTMKFEETISLLTSTNDKVIEQAEEKNYSTYAFITNLTVARKAPSRVLGTGLGTHKESYELIYPERKSKIAHLYGLNRDDAYSLGIRLFSELGIVGFLFIVYIAYMYYNKENVYNFMAFGYLVNAFITGGHYTAYGLMLFVFLFYCTRKGYRKNIIQKYHL